MSVAKMSPHPMRIGLGTDIHRLVEGQGIYLGGVYVPCPFSCVAVSDGDVLLHALTDALLGACGWGDIGDWYSENNVVPGQASSLFVREVINRVAAAGYEVSNADCVVDMEFVRLAERKGAMRDSLASLLSIPEERVNVKAKTGEGLGSVGEGRAVAAQVVVLLVRAESAQGGEL